MRKSALIIGSGFAGLSAACFMAKAGWEVTVIEKNDTAGGRARRLQENGYTFDMGPSWYWMPDVFERFFALFGKRTNDYYSLQRLDPSYRVYWPDGFTDIPASYSELKQVVEFIEAGSAAQLDKFLQEAAYKYEVGIKNLVYKPGLSISEFLDWQVIKGIFRLDVFTSMKKHVGKYFQSEKLRQIMQFPILFLGALPSNTPALYSLMNYADIKGGTWYPGGGIYAVVQAMYQLAKESEVHFHFNENVTRIITQNGRVAKVVTSSDEYSPDVVISNADYHFTETKLLSPNARTYSDKYWSKKVMAPSCLLYYIGLNKKLAGIRHHSLFFDVPFDRHADEIYTNPRWPDNPLFYANVTSVTDPSIAPPGCDSLFLLIPVAAGLQGDDEALRQKYLQLVLRRMEKHTQQKISDSIVFSKSFSVSDFVHDYNSFRGNAYGLANTLFQTAVFKPSCRSRKIKNLFYTGQLTVPGPGVPPAIISGEVTAMEVLKSYDNR